MTINHSTSTLVLDERLALIDQAHTYFGGLGLAADDELDPDIQDSDGLVSYVVASSNPPPDEIRGLYEEVAPIMEGLTNVVVSAVIKMAGSDPVKKHDPETWRTPMQNMVKAFCAGFSETEKQYHQTVRGVEVATKFLNILLDAVVSEGTAAFSGFVKFLQSQGETMRAEISEGQNRYLYGNVAIAHEIFQASDGTWIYVPKFKSYFTQFNQETFKITSSCGSYHSFKFDFDLRVMSGAFMISSWKDSAGFRRQVRAFIDRFQKTNIEDSGNYFNDIFNSTQG